MPVAKQLYVDPPKLGQCEATRTGKYANDTPRTDRRCVHSARYEIEGRLLCTKHAQARALQILLAMDDAANAEKE
jgi:hypothetical protein